MRHPAAILYAILVAGLLPLSARQKGPGIEFDSPTRDVSRVFDGEVIKQVFKFTNRGDETLEITGVEPACGCTSALPVPSKVAPGQSGQIKVEIKTENFAALTTKIDETVAVSKTVTVRTNDPKQPQVVLTVNFNVAPEIVASEWLINLGSSPRGQELARDLMVEIAPDRPIKLLGAVSTDASVTVRMEPLAGAGNKKFKVIVIQKPTAAEGFHFGNIVIKTTSQLKPQLTVNVRGTVTKGDEAQRPRKF